MSTLNVDDINLGGRTNNIRGADIASAATTDLSAATGDLVHITGTVGITSFGTAPQAGVIRNVIFDGILILTNSANIVLPGSQDILTAAGDSAVFIADSVSSWKCMQYTRAAAKLLEGTYLATQVLTSGTTYSPTAGARSALIRMVGGGGAGGSATAVAGSANGGGGSGGYAEYALSNIAGTYTYAIGAGGTAVAGGAGNAGGNTTFVDGLTTVTAYGGAGGTFSAGTAAVKYTAGGAGGNISTNGTVNGAGVGGGTGMTSSVVTVGKAGNGGESFLGGSGIGGLYATAVAVAGGTAVANTGSGGGGGGTGAVTVAAGGNGAAGIIIITEYR